MRFHLIDRVVSWEPGKSLRAAKFLALGEEYLADHFPKFPVMPGVLQLDAIAQVAGILMIIRNEKAGQIAYFMSAEDVKWRKPVVPGDTLVIEVTLNKLRGRVGRGRGVCKVRGEVVSEAEVTFMLADAANG